MRKLMKVKKPGTRPSWTTRDHFVACIPWNENSAVLVHQRERGRRFYVRFRTWNRHQTKGVWYPTKRGFIIPLQRAEALAESLVDAVKGRMSEKPDGCWTGKGRSGLGSPWSGETRSTARFRCWMPRSILVGDRVAALSVAISEPTRLLIADYAPYPCYPLSRSIFWEHSGHTPDVLPVRL